MHDAIARAAFNKKKIFHVQIWSIGLYGAEIRTLRKVHQKYFENFEMRCCRRMEVIWTGCMKNDVLRRVKDERNILHRVKRRKTSWIGHISRKKCILKLIIERKIEGTVRRGRRLKQPLDDLTETRRYCKLKGKALYEELALEEAMDL